MRLLAYLTAAVGVVLALALLVTPEPIVLLGAVVAALATPVFLVLSERVP